MATVKCRQCGRKIKWLRRPGKKPVMADARAVPFFRTERGYGECFWTQDGCPVWGMETAASEAEGFAFRHHGNTCPAAVRPQGAAKRVVAQPEKVKGRAPVGVDVEPPKRAVPDAEQQSLFERN